MSRNIRGREHVSRWGKSFIGPAKKAKKFTAGEQVDYLNRVIKRLNKAAGYDTAKEPSRWEYDVSIKGKSFGGQVFGHTRSEARAAVKKHIGLPKSKRLPTTLKLEKVDVALTD